ncbi:hypothetical protein [Cellvibrio japonicus]|nr:hypothetical protein [Cellvibrio japonicus]
MADLFLRLTGQIRRIAHPKLTGGIASALRAGMKTGLSLSHRHCAGDFNP